MADEKDVESTRLTSREEYTTAIAKTQSNWDRMTAHEKAGTPYPVSEQELHILQDPTFGPSNRGWRRFPDPVSLTSAHSALKDNLAKRVSWAQVAARQRLLDLHNAPYGTRSPGLLIKMINDLDTLLFGGVLRNRILVHWVDYSIFTKKLHALTNKEKNAAHVKASHDPTFLATTVVPPSHLREEVRPAVYLSAEIMCLAAQSRVRPLALLIHEMLHAHISLMVRTEEGGDDVEDHGHAATEHGPLFEESCNALAGRLGFKGLNGRDILHYYRHPQPVELPRVEQRRRVRLADGLMHYVVPR